MIKGSVLYSDSDNAEFDMDYYMNTHIPLVRSKLGTAGKRIDVERGISGMAPDIEPVVQIGLVRA